MKDGTAVVVERHERITGYATVLAFFGHAVAETNLDLQALIASAEAFAGPGIIVPTRNSGLFRWCLENGLRVVQPMTLMTLGLYNEPAGAHICLPYSSEAITVSRLRNYRVLDVLANDIVIWFWIGSHDNYARLIRELR
jgi:hypothetical protein